MQDYATTESKDIALVRARDAGIVPDQELVKSVRARYLMALRERLQSDQSVSAAVRASVPATDAYKFVEGNCWQLVQEGTEDVYRDAIMFLLAELDELRQGPDQAYVVDTASGEIVAPMTGDVVFQPEPYEEELTLPNGQVEKVLITPKPILNPKITASLMMKAAADHREAEVRRRAEDPVGGRAYLHLTNPQRIAELASQRLSESGIRRSDEESAMDGEMTLVNFGQETNESDLQATNPFFHRLYSYSAILASRIMALAGTGGEYWMSDVRGNRDEEVRWYSVLVRVRRAG